MGKRFLKIVLLPDDGGSVRNFRFSERTIRGAIVCLIGLVLALGASLAFHVRTFREAQLMGCLRSENLALRDQIDEFRRTAGELRDGVSRTGRLEREARLLAGLDPVDEETRKLGIGGSPLETEPAAAIRDSRLRGDLRDRERQLDQLERELAFQERSYSEVLATLQTQRERLDHTPTICPVHSAYTLSSGFGSRPDPFTGRVGFHSGLDLRAAPGTAVVATAHGDVSFVGYNGDFGLTIHIDHGRGLETVYCHLASSLVRVGETVHRGEKIGSVGNSGRSTGPHLHYEVWINGRPADPKTYVLTPSIIVD